MNYKPSKAERELEECFTSDQFIRRVIDTLKEDANGYRDSIPRKHSKPLKFTPCVLFCVDMLTRPRRLNWIYMRFVRVLRRYPTRVSDVRSGNEIVLPDGTIVDNKRRNKFVVVFESDPKCEKASSGRVVEAKGE